MVKKLTNWTFLLLYMFCISLLMLPQRLSAQDPGMPGDPGYDPDTEVPIDGGVAMLLIAGLAYGIKKVKDNR